MKWIVSIEFKRAKAFHNFFSMLNRGRIRNTKMTNYDLNLMLIEFETTDKPNYTATSKDVVDVKIVGSDEKKS